MRTQATSGILWLLAASVLGFLISKIFSDRLKLSRRLFLLAYIPLGAGFVALFADINQIGWQILMVNWPWGLLAGLLASLFLVSNVRSQPNSRESAGGELALDMAWLGLGYGLIDGLFLNVFPVLAVRQVFGQAASNTSSIPALAVAAAGLLASLVIALTYHLGYSEYRNASVAKVLIGNGIITLAFLVSGNPLAAVLSHVVMHVAAVIQGPETTLQLPPHRANETHLGA